MRIHLAIVLTLVVLVLFTGCQEELVFPPIEREGQGRKEVGEISSRELKIINHTFRSLDEKWEGEDPEFNQEMENLGLQIEGTLDQVRGVSNQLNELVEQMDAFVNYQEDPPQ